MALRNQPYIPLYVQDFLTDEKLAECSAESTGVYIRLMCLMHKSQEYGCILLKQKDKQILNFAIAKHEANSENLLKQKDKQILNFACKLAKQMPYSVEVIRSSLQELIEEEVLQIEEDKLWQKRMVKDNDISEKRSISGKKGGKRKQSNEICYSKSVSKTASKSSEFAIAKVQANSEYENEYEIEYENDNENEKKLKESFQKFWDAYPLKVSEDRAYSVWSNLNPDDELVSVILQGVQAARMAGKFDDPDFAPYPATWISESRWKDKYPPKKKPKGSADYDQRDYSNGINIRDASDGDTEAALLIRHVNSGLDEETSSQITELNATDEEDVDFDKLEMPF